MTHSLTFGFKRKSTQTFGTGIIESIYPINSYENIITTSKEILKIENTTIKKSLKSQFSTSLYIPKANLLVASTLQKGELFVYAVNDFSHPIITNFQTNQLGIFHLIYSEKSSLLITYGSGIKIWNFELVIPDRRLSSSLPTVKISLRNTFSNYEASILNPPAFDYINEYIIIPTIKGIIGYDKDLKQKVLLSKVPANSKTAHCYIQTKAQLLVYESSSGILLCTETGFVHSRFTVGNSTVIWMDYLDSEHAITMDAKGNFYLVNLETGKSFNCYSVLNPSAFSSDDNSAYILSAISKSGLSQINGGVGGCNNAKLIPSRIYLMHNADNEIALCTGMHLQLFKISIPMKLWSQNVVKSQHIRRYEKPNQAARLLSFTNNSFVKIFSPKDGKNLTAATPQSASNPISYLYDRGYLVYFCTNDEGEIVKKFTKTNTDEKIYMLQDNGRILIFDDNTNPCKEISQFDLKASCISICYFEGEFCYAIGSMKNSEIYIVDKADLTKLKKKFTMGNDQFCCIKFDAISNCLICVMNKTTFLLDLTKETIVSTLNMKGCRLVELNNQRLYYGYENGEIIFARIVSNSTKNSLELVSKEPSKLHIDSITGFAFSSSFWVSVSTDKTVRYWDDLNNNFFTITTPYTLYGCEVLNSNRDVVVGTENELMKIDGKTVFHGEIDDYNEVLDSRDDKNDPLKELILNDLLKKKKEAEEKEEKKAKEEEMRIKKQQLLEKQKRKKRKLNLSKEALEILKRLDNQIPPEPSNTQEMKQILKDEEEERKRKALDAMMNMTNNPKPIQMLIKQTKNKVEEKENEEEELIEVEEEELGEIENEAHTPRKKRKSARQKSTINSNDQIEIETHDQIELEIRNQIGEKKPPNEQSLTTETVEKEEISIIEKAFGTKQGITKQKVAKKTKELNVFELIHKNQVPLEKVEDDKQSIATSPISEENYEEETNELHLKQSNTNQPKRNRKPFNTDIKEPSHKTATNQTEVRDKNEETNKNEFHKKEKKLEVDKTDKTKHETHKKEIKHEIIEKGNKSVKAEMISEPKETKSKCPRHNNLKPNNNKMSTSSPIKKFIKQRSPTPPPIINRLFNEDMRNIRKGLNNQLRKSTRSNSTPNLPRIHRFFEMPPPQYVLDYEAVQMQYQRGVVELLPLVQRINIDRTRNIQNLINPNKTLANNNIPQNSIENSSMNQFLNTFSNNSMKNSQYQKNAFNVLKNSGNGGTIINSPRPLIQQSKKHVIEPMKRPPMFLLNNSNNLSARNRVPTYKKLQQLSPPLLKPLGQLEDSATVTNSLNLTPRHLFTRDKKFAPNRRPLKMIYRTNGIK